MTTMRIVRQNFVSGAYYAQMRGKGGGADDPNKRLENKLMVKIITIINAIPKIPPLSPI